MTMKIGNLIFYKNIPEFGSWLQRIVTNTIYSHVSLYAGYNANIQQMMEFDASFFVRFRSFNSQSPYMDIMSVNAPRGIKALALMDAVEAYEGRSYGYIQWLTIGIRYLCEWLGFKNVKSWNILWGWGIICSELIWYYFVDVSNRVIEISTGTEKLVWQLFLAELNTYNPDLFTPQDIIDLSRRFETILKVEPNE